MLNLTASALTSSPLWNFTFGRSLNSHVVEFTEVHDVARPGSCASWPSFTVRRTRWSNTLCTTANVKFSACMWGSSVVGSAPCAMTICPSGAAMAAAGRPTSESATTSAAAVEVSQERIELPPGGGGDGLQDRVER